MTATRALLWALIAAALAAVLAGCGQLAVVGTPTTAAPPAPPATTTTAITAPTPAAVTLAPEKCFGAVARDDSAGLCATAAHGDEVVPTPAVAAETPNAPCNSAHREGVLYVCSFGVAAKQAVRTIALIGDSHAAMWRAALAPIATAERWHGISIMHPGCPFNALVRDIGGEQRNAACGRWQKQILPWLDRNPQVSVLFLGGLSSSPFIAPFDESNFTAAIDGYQQVWQQLPANIQHVVVMRDTPRFGAGNLGCINRAMAAGAKARLVCAVPRAVAEPPDPELVAASAMGTPHFQSIDVNNEICGPNYCYPVVGGALVLKDFTHMTRTFARTLAPAVLAQLQVLMQGWAPGTR
jgi:SGNH domain (fused to AT3 domains)